MIGQMCTFFSSRQDLLKWNGWGFRDCKFVLDPVKELVSFEGERFVTLILMYYSNDAFLSYIVANIVHQFSTSVHSRNPISAVN